MLLQETVPLSPSGGGGLCIGPASLWCADIIVTSDTNSLVSDAIRIGTFSDVSHALIYMGGDQVVEALFQGVTMRSLRASLGQDTLAVAYRHIHITQAKAAQIRRLIPDCGRRRIVHLACFRSPRTAY
jgi:hypothetical protein